MNLTVTLSTSWTPTSKDDPGELDQEHLAMLDRAGFTQNGKTATVTVAGDNLYRLVDLGAIANGLIAHSLTVA